MPRILGLQKTCMVDFPPYLSCTVFISGCNFRCGFCHNADLVNDSKDLQEISEEEIFEFLEKRKNVLDGVCITGGEPTLYSNLKGFIKKIKEIGYKVKLDTNGTDPKLLKELIDGKLLDFIAMDIKSSKEKYNLSSGVKVDMDKLQESIDLIRNSGLDYEFRSTIHPKIIDSEDIVKIGEWLKGSKKYSLQQFVVLEKTLDQEFMSSPHYDVKELEEFKKLLEPYFDSVELRA